MDKYMKEKFQELESPDKSVQVEAFEEIMMELNQEVSWAYEVWDELRTWLTDEDPHKRAIGAQFLAGLAISDPKNRILEDFPLIWEVTKDEKFVTARHSLQSIWRVGLGGEEQLSLVLNHLTERYMDTTEKNYTLIRFDIITGLRHLYDFTDEEVVKETAEQLLEMEEDEKYRKKYAKVWK